MINTSNYYQRLKNVDISTLPEKFRDGHETVNLITGDGKSWKYYDGNPEYKRIIDDYFSQLNNYLSGQAAPSVSKKSSTKQHLAPVKHEPKKASSRSPVKGETASTARTELVERIPDEIKFIKRFVGLQDKVKTRPQILSFLSSLQKAIVEKRIRKTSPYAKHIVYIQDMLIDLHNNHRRATAITIAPSRLKSLQEAVGTKQMIASIPYIKRYLNMHGKPDMREKAGKLYSQIEKAVMQKKITTKDPYYDELTKIRSKLFDFYGDRKEKILNLSQTELNGLEGILGCSCSSLNGIDSEDDSLAEDEPRVISSMDFANERFQTIGFKGKWHALIGDPMYGFTVMVFGRPKMGKSYLCLDFAGYLARNHGKVLYVAKEEGLDATLQQKTKDKNVAHPNLLVSDGLPKDLSPYDFIFLDSVSKLRLTPQDLEELEEENPGKSFIYIFQSTKAGKFKGSNEYQHDVDAVIEVPERGKAIQFGRFNQGGEIDIFDQNKEGEPLKNVYGLDGIRKKKAVHKVDWTEPEYLNKGDHATLKRIRDYYEAEDFDLAMSVAYNADTIIRDAIPAKIWKNMGGKLTKTGEENLRKEEVSK